MSMESKWRQHIQERKNLFVIIAIGLLLLELEIFAMAAMKSGRETRLQILDQNGYVVFVTTGSHLDAIAKTNFERTFGPLANYQVNLITEERPFQFRAWFAAAAGLPIAAVLLFGFFVKAYEALFIGTSAQSESGRRHSMHADSKDAAEGRLERMVARVGRLNIFAVGAMVLLAALGLWAVPYMLDELGRYGVERVVRYKWVFLGLGVTFLGLVVWIIYLRYLLARKAIEQQTELEKFRLQLEMGARQEMMLLPGADCRADDGKLLSETAVLADGVRKREENQTS